MNWWIYFWTDIFGWVAVVVVVGWVVISNMRDAGWLGFDSAEERLEKEFEDRQKEAYLDRLRKHLNNAPEYRRKNDPTEAAIIDGDFDLYEKLLDDLTDEQLLKEIDIPGSGNAPVWPSGSRVYTYL